MIKEELRWISHYTHYLTGLTAELSFSGFLAAARNVSLPKALEPVVDPTQLPA